MIESPYLGELRLTSFKSFRDAVLPLRDLTLLIGRNGSGKSNAVDGLVVLSKLAQGDDIRDAIEGSRAEGGEVRGGVRGCTPFGEQSFSLGCRVRSGEECFELDVTVCVEPDVQIASERLWFREGNSERSLLQTDTPEPERLDIVARYDNGKQGKNPALPFRSTRLLAAQVPNKVPSGSPATKRVHRAAEGVREALEAVFVLDPVPSLMRQYVPSRDTVLRRRADNLSAAIGALLRNKDTASRLRELVQALPEHAVDGITVESSSLGDVIIALDERRGRSNVPVSARVMSDGMLRFLAFATALLEAPLLDREADVEVGHTMLVIEEIENGLHPSRPRERWSSSRRRRTAGASARSRRRIRPRCSAHSGRTTTRASSSAIETRSRASAGFGALSTFRPTRARWRAARWARRSPNADWRTCPPVTPWRSSTPCSPDADHGTGPFVELAGAGVLGTGDLAILAERELYSERTANVRVTVWTHDARLAAYAG